MNLDTTPYIDGVEDSSEVSSITYTISLNSGKMFKITKITGAFSILDDMKELHESSQIQYNLLSDNTELRKLYKADPAKDDNLIASIDVCTDFESEYTFIIHTWWNDIKYENLTIEYIVEEE